MTKRRFFCAVAIAAMGGAAISLLWSSRPAGQSSFAAASSTQQSVKASPGITPSAPLPSTPGITQTGERALIAARAWVLPVEEPRMVAFREWTQQYFQSTEAERSGLVAAGANLARGRLVALRELVDNDPRAVLGGVIPWAVRRGLPPEIAHLLEQRISGVGQLNVMVASSLDGGTLSSSVRRRVTVNGETMDAFTFGDAERLPSQPALEINGLALPDRTGAKLAFSPFPARLLEPDEARNFLTAQSPGILCPISKKRLEDGSEVYVIQRSGISSPFCSLPHAQDTVGGLPPEGWDFLAYGGPDSGLAKTASVMPTGGGASGITDATVTKKLNCRYLLIRHQYSDSPSYVADASMTTAYNNYRGALSAGSYGQRTGAALSTTLNATDSWLLPVQLMPHTRAEYSAGTADISLDTYNQVRPLLQAAGQDYTNFDHFVMIDIDSNGLVGGGLGSYGSWYPGYAGYPTAAKMGWVWGGFNADTIWDTFLLSHECGHNLFLAHAHLWKTNSISVIGPGTTDEYGDGYDPMGGGDWNRGYMGNYRMWLGWIPATDAPQITGTGTTTNRVYTFDENSTAQARVLRIPHTVLTSQAYWIEHRDGINGGAQSAELNHSVYVHWGGINGAEGWRLKFDSARLGADHLYLGHTFSDRKAGIYITPIAQVGTVAVPAVDVVVTRGNSLTNQPPAVTLTASTTTPASGADVTFTATATDPEGDALAYGWDFGQGTLSWNNAASTLSWNNAASQVRSFTTGEYTVQLVVSDMKGGETRKSVVIHAGSPATFRLAGTLLVDGLAAGGVRVEAGGKYALTDSDGTYTITGLAAGTYTVTAHDPVAEESAFTSSSATITNSNVTAIDFFGETAASANIGLTGTYYSGTDFNTLKLTRRDAKVDFDWGSGSPGGTVPVDGFSARWTGNLLATTSGVYAFHVLADEGARLYLDGALILDQWNSTALAETTAYAALLGGTYHDVRLEYRDNAGVAQVRFSWTPPGAAKGVVPDGALTPQTNFIVAEYYDDTNLGAANFRGSRAETTVIDHDYGTTGPDVPGISQTNFSVRWTGKITPAATGTYTFHTDADDGTRLWVNGTQLINNWITQGVTEKTGTITLTAGQTYDLKLEYFQGTGGASVKLSWTPPGGIKTTIPISSFSPPDRPADLYAEFWNNKTLAGDPAVTRWDDDVDFAFGTGSPDPRIVADGFSARWSGRVLATTAGSYTFETYSDDGVRLWVNGVQIINNWTDHGPTTNTGTITLAAGAWYDLRLEYYESTGSGEIHLKWKPPGLATSVVIPVANLAVQGGNSAPFIEPVADITIEAIRSLTVTPVALDAENNSFTWKLGAGAPSGMSITSGTGVVTWTPTTAQVGTYAISVTATDNGTPALAATDTFSVTVTPTTNFVWTATGTSTALPWSGPANWLGGAVPTSGTQTAVNFLSGITLGAGTVTANHDLGLTLHALTLDGSGPASGTATLALTGGALTFTGANELHLDASNGTGLTYNVGMPLILGGIANVSGGGTASFRLNGAITGGGLNKISIGTLALTVGNSFSNTVTVAAGRLFPDHVNALSGSTGLTVASGAEIQANAAGTYANVPSTLEGTGVAAFEGAIYFRSGGSTAVTWPGAITLGAGGATIHCFGVAYDATLSGAIGGTGALTLAGRGGSTASHTVAFTLSGANSYGGATTLLNNDGLLDAKLRLGANNTLPTATTLTLDGTGPGTKTATFDLNGFSQQLAGLGIGTGPVNLTRRVLNTSATTSTLTLGPAGTLAFSGNLGATGANNFALTKSGAGALSLSGTNTYTGATTVLAGTLTLGTAIASSPLLDIRSGATLNATATGVTTSALQGGGTLAGAAIVNGTHAPGDGVGTQTFTGPLSYGATAHLSWELIGNTATGAGTAFDKVAAAGLTITSGAVVDVKLSSAGSVVNLTDAFWAVVRTWPLATATSLTGGFGLGTVTADSGGRSVATYGAFTVSGVTLTWTPAVDQMASGLLARWPFDGNFNDLTGNGWNLAAGGNAAFSTTAKQGGQSLALDGSGDQAATAAALPLGSVFTLAAWIYVPSGTTQMQTIAANSASGTTTSGLRFYVNSFNSGDGKLVLETGNGTVGVVLASPTAIVAFDRWQYVAVVVNRTGGTATLYRNGFVVATGAVRTDFANSAVFTLGAMNTLYGLRTNLDDARLYNRALTQSEIAALINKQNLAPTISALANKVLTEGGSIGALTLTINDVETAPANLVLTATSSNTALVPVPNIAFGGSGTARTINVTPAVNQIGTSTITVTVNDGALTATSAFIVTVTAASQVNTWRFNNFGTTANTGSSANLANPDGDSFANLMEYAFGTSPTIATTGKTALPSIISGRLALTFPRNTAATDLTLTAQGADSPAGPWTDLARSTSGAAFVVITTGASATETGTGAIKTVEVRDLYTTTAHPKRFLRLRVQL